MPHLLHKAVEAAVRVQLETEASGNRLATVTLSGQNIMRLSDKYRCKKLILPPAI